MARRLGIIALALAAGCSTKPPHDSPLDPLNPNAADGVVTGTVLLDGVGVDYGVVPLDEVEISVGGRAPVRARADGSFRVDGVRPGTWDVTLRAHWYEPQTVARVTVAPRDPTALGAVTLHRGRGTVSGRVLLFGLLPSDDHSGTTVTVRDHPASEPRFSVTNAEGDFVVTDVIAGLHGLSLTRPFYPTGSLEGVDVPAGGEANVGEVTLGKDAATVSGTVALEGISPPSPEYAAVSISLVGTGATANPSPPTAGDFTLTTTLGGIFTVEATRDGWEPALLPGVIVVPGKPTALPSTLTLRPSVGAIVGVVDIPGESDLSGAEVFVVGGSAKAYSDGSGHFRIDGVPLRPATVQIFAQKLSGSTTFVLDRPRQVNLLANQAVDAGTLVLSRFGGDYSLVGRIDARLATNPGWTEDSRLTAEDWVYLDLARLSADPQASYAQIRRAWSRQDLQVAVWEPFAYAAQPTCLDPANRLAASTCIELPAGDGDDQVWIELQLAAGGATVGPFVGNIRLDQHGPDRPPGTPAIEVNGGAAWVNASGGTTAVLALAAVDAVSPVTAMKIWADAKPGTDDEPGAAEPFRVAASLPLPPGDGLKWFHAIFYDAAGNPSPHFARSIGVDTQAPTLAAPTLAAATGGAPGYTPTPVVNVGIAAGGSPNEALTVLLSEQPGLAGALRVPHLADGAGALVVQEPFFLAAGDGPHTVYVAVEDAAGNRSVPASATITLDTVAPSAPVVQLLENDARPRNGATNQPDVTLEIYAAADTAKLEVAGCSNLVEIVFSGPPAPLETRSCTLPATTQGFKLVVLRAVDAAGNESGPATAGVVLDTAAPPLPAFQLLRGPQSNPASVAKFVNATLVGWSAAPGSEAPDEVELVETLPAPCSPCTVTSGWIPFATAGSYLLGSATNGSHAVAATFRDAADNQTSPVSDAVVLDTIAPPVPGLAAPPPAYVSAAASVTLDFQAVSPAAEPNFWRFEVEGGAACANGCAVNAPGGFAAGLVANAQNLLRLRTRDQAGNASADTLYFVTHDDQPPAPNPPVIVSPSPSGVLVTASPLLAVYVAAETDALSGVDRFEGQVSTPAAGCVPGGWTAQAGTNAFSFPLPRNVRSLVCLRAVDRAGNATGAASLTVDEDDQPPQAPVLRGPPLANADTVFLWLSSPVPHTTPAAAATGGSFDPGDHLDHFEVIGGPFSTWTVLPVGYDPKTRAITPCTSGCAWDGRDFFEVPLAEDVDNAFSFRAVDTAGNVGPGSVFTHVQEKSTYALASIPAGAYHLAPPRIDGDRVLWLTHPGGVAADTIQLLDLAKAAPGDAPAQLYAPASLVLGSAAVARNRVGWSEKGNLGSQDVYYCDLPPATSCDANKVVLASSADTETDVHLAGSYVAWLDATQNKIVVKDTAGGGLTNLPPYGGATSIVDFSLSGDLVAWRQGGGSAPIASQRLAGAARAVSLSTSAWVSSPSVSGGVIAWSEATAGANQLFLSEDAKGNKIAIPPGGGNRLTPSVWTSNGHSFVAAPDDGLGVTGFFATDWSFASPGSSPGATIPVGGSGVEVAVSGRRALLRRVLPTSYELSIYDWSWWHAAEAAPFDQTGPAVSGSRLAWLDARWHPNLDVVVLDAATGTRTCLTCANPALATFAKGPLALDGNLVAWRESDGSTARMRWHDLATGNEGVLTSCGGSGSCTPAGSECFPAVSGYRVAFAVWNGADRDVCLVDDVRTPAPVLAASGAADQSRPSLATVAGKARVVWREGSDKLMLKDGAAAPVCIVGPGCLAADAGVKLGSSVDGDLVAYEDGSSRLHLYDHLAHTTRFLTDPNVGQQSQPILRGRRVVYAEIPPGGAAQVRLYDIDADVHYRLALGLGEALAPAFDGASAAWQDDALGSWDVVWSRSR